MVSKAQAKIVTSSFCRRHPYLETHPLPIGIPSEQTAKDLPRMTAVSAPRRTIFTFLRNISS